jgi:hypothetical protein
MSNVDIKELDFFNNNFDKKDFFYVRQNIKNFINQIEQYKNILFISSDFPSYGGSATNCYNLEQTFNKLNHNTFSIYYLHENIEQVEIVNISENTKYILKKDLNDYLKNLEFKPDLIILKSFTDLNLKDYFNCLIYYLVPGIFKDELNKYYYDLEDKQQKKFINKSVINQIINSDLSFCNSAHTKYIIEKHFNLKTSLFYSSFISYYNKKIYNDINFHKRKYDYCLIVSNFDRPIKNVMKSIIFLKNKKNVLLIGKNSFKFNNYGFETIDLINNNTLQKYYRKVKCIIQDSFFESCSNVMVESIFNGCKNYIFITFSNDLIDSNFYNTLFDDWNVHLKIFTNNSKIINNENDYVLIDNNIDTKEEFINYYLENYGNIFFIDINSNLQKIKNLNINLREDFICFNDDDIIFFNLYFNPLTNKYYDYIKIYNI